MALNNALLKAVNRYGPSVDNLARSRYGVSGAALLAKLVQGESGGQPNRTSPAGAQGYTQFMPGSRRIAIDRYGVDPLAGADQAVHAAALHLLGKINGSKGLEGYNPGDPSYPNYILGQRVGNVHRGGSMGGSSAPSSPQSVTTTVTPGTTSGGGFDPGAGGDQTALLAALLSHPKAPSPVSVPTPAFAQNRYLKVGASPTVDAPQQQAPDMGSLLDALQAQGTDLPAGPSSAAPSVKVHVTGAQKAPSGAQGGRALALRGGDGKVIGVPYQGTHTLGNWQSDNAVDISTPIGTVVQLPEAGVVEKVKGSYQGGAGRFDGIQVTVRMADGRQIFYTHLSKAHVRPGQKLAAGQAVGRSGAANGVPHLHAAVDRGDPRKLF